METYDDRGLQAIIGACLFVALVGSWLLCVDLMGSRYRYRAKKRERLAATALARKAAPGPREIYTAPPVAGDGTLPTVMELRNEIREGVARTERIEYIKRKGR